MRFVSILACCLVSVYACSPSSQPLVARAYVDSVMLEFDSAILDTTLEKEMAFWKSRIKPEGPDLVNSIRYAQLLSVRFQKTGEIQDLHTSDSILKAVASKFHYKDVGPYPGMIRNAISMHAFKRADSLLQQATAIGLRRYEAAALDFDVFFELGQITIAKLALQRMNAENDYGYQFRKAKLKHYLGETDSAIAAMEAAVKLAGDDKSLWQTAVSNLADLQLHAGRPVQAFEKYVTCLREDPADLHSIMRVGWIALMYDGNPVLAERIFTWAATKTALPDPYFKLMAVAESKEDVQSAKHYAKLFAEKASAPAYGEMYNKYLIQVYVDALETPTIALPVAESELNHRNTPQTNAWYSYALLKNGSKATAELIYKERISGKPLEGLEHYYMALLTRSSGNLFAARKYIKLAQENKFDLTPRMLSKLDTLGKN
jgi:tetratricopeptide (TPR) repeat protein